MSPALLGREWRFPQSCCLGLTGVLLAGICCQLGTAHQFFSNLLHAHHISLPPPDVPLLLFLRPHQAEASGFARQWNRLGWVVLEAASRQHWTCRGFCTVSWAISRHWEGPAMGSAAEAMNGRGGWPLSVSDAAENGRTLFCINCSPPFLSPCLGSEMLEIEGGEKPNATHKP